MGKNSSTKNDDLIFAEEVPKKPPKDSGSQKKFKLLIVDDEQEVHVMTKLVLADYSYKNFTLEFLSAFSGREAKKLISENPDAAVILLDVVMETKSAGLDVAKFIRKEQKNHKIRIILRTGQPGKAPEKDIILNYDINDYKEKTELTTQKLFTTVTTALRSYIYLQDLEEKNKEIATKNALLNEEIARRLVAESNLAKYNRSLEKMIDSKSRRLKKALLNLAVKEKELVEATRLAQVGDISTTSLGTLDNSGNDLKTNLERINRYRLNLTQLLEKYDVLQNIITSHARTSKKIDQKTSKVIDGIDQFKKEIDLKQILKKYPGIIQDSTKGIKNISRAVNDIKLFISICDEPKQESDIEKHLNKIIKSTAKDYSSKISIQTDFDGVPQIHAAQNAFKRAFYEIIKNAFEAVGPSGIISVETLCENNDILVRFSDNGNGISDQHQNLIFKPYFTTKKQKGLGLSLAKNVILSHRGSVHVSSSPKQGTCVTVKLPV